MDDKCACCGEWTAEAYERYSGFYNDGSEMDECECDEADLPTRNRVATKNPKAGNSFVGQISTLEPDDEVEPPWEVERIPFGFQAPVCAPASLDAPELPSQAWADWLEEAQ